MRLINSDGQIVDASVSARDNGNATSVRVDMGPMVLIVSVLLMIVIGACGVVMGLNLGRLQTLTETAQRADRDATLLAYYVNEVDGKLIHAGFIEPRERWSPAKKAELSEKLEETEP